MDLSYLPVALIGLVLALIIGKLLLPVLTSLKVGQSIREEGPASHQVKSGTPTMGGLIFYIATLIALISTGHWDGFMGVIVFSTLAFAGIGFIDDYIKVIEKRNLGLTSKQKLVLQILISCLILLYLKAYHNLGTDIILPFTKNTFDLRWLYYPFIVFVIVGTSNSTNLTDGLDGLAGGIAVFCFAFFLAIGKYFELPSVVYFSAAMIGGLLGFLYYNRYPAKVFMGDLGSLGLGGAIASIAVITKLPLVLLIVCGVYVCETLSVIIQVASYKLFKRRVFLMSPIHHHFEMKGWKENKIVKVFYAVSCVLAAIAYFSVR